MDTTLLRLGLRAQRTGMVAIAVVGLLFTFLNSAGYAAVAGNTRQERIAFARATEVLATQVSYMLPLPVGLETLAGFVQWRAFGALPVVLAGWALLSASGALRGDEERGEVEAWLAAGVPRMRYVVGRAAAFATGAVAAVVAACAGAWTGARVAGQPLGAGAVLGQGVVTVALCLACYGIAAVAAQLATTRRAAAGTGTGVLLVLFSLNSLSRTRPELAVARWVSPFGLYDRSPALRGEPVDWIATLVLVLGGLLLTALAALAFARRDVGAALGAPAGGSGQVVRAPGTLAPLRAVWSFALWEQRWSLLWWSAGTAGLTVFFLSLTGTLVELMQSTPRLRVVLGAMAATGSGGASPEQAFLGFAWSGVFQLLLAAFVVTQVAQWAAEDASGRLELTLAAPVSRMRVALERFVALALACALLVLPAAAVLALLAPSQRLVLDGGAVLGSALLLVPLGIALGGVGAVLVGWAPRAATIGVGAFAAAGFFLQQLIELFHLPAWTTWVSPFALYGAPLAQGPQPVNLALLAVAVVLVALSVRTLQGRDVAA